MLTAAMKSKAVPPGDWAYHRISVTVFLEQQPLVASRPPAAEYRRVLQGAAHTSQRNRG